MGGECKPLCSKWGKGDDQSHFRGYLIFSDSSKAGPEFIIVPKGWHLLRHSVPVRPTCACFGSNFNVPLQVSRPSANQARTARSCSFCGGAVGSVGACPSHALSCDTQQLRPAAFSDFPLLGFGETHRPLATTPKECGYASCT